MDSGEYCYLLCFFLFILTITLKGNGSIIIITSTLLLEKYANNTIKATKIIKYMSVI